MNEQKKTAHIVSHTHWDREWRYPIWQTTAMLVEFMDELLDLLEAGTLKGFLMDGQTRPVLDYIEQRPENRERIKALIEGDKLEIGPWYTLPDEYPIEGEALVRNLLKGIKVSGQLGKTFKVGYTPFGWGQTAQLPQIYRGFGIEIGMIGKRVSERRAPDSEFKWRGPDGSELLATRFGELGRQNFFLRLHLSVLFGRHYESEQWKYNLSDQVSLYHRCDREHMEQDFFRLDSSEAWDFSILTPDLIESVWQTAKASRVENDRLMMNGCDYAAGQKRIPELIEKLNQLDAPNNRQWRQTTMREYVQLWADKLADQELTTVEGELRDGPAGPTSGNALSTRLYIKALNKKAQNLLIRQAEPLAAVTTIFHNCEYPANFIEAAWEHLLLAHPHDSINGVTQDKTAEDVVQRLNQVVDISDTLTDQAMREIIGRLDLNSFAEDEELLAVFNPYPHPRRQIVEAWVATERYRPENEFWPLGDDGIQVLDGAGNLCGTQWHGLTNECYPVAELHNRALPFNCSRHHIYFDTGELPACGYKIFRVLRGQKAVEVAGVAPKSSRLLSSPSILKEANVLENEYLRVTVNPNGTFDLLDKIGDQLYSGLNYYRDRGQVGDYWIDKSPMHDQIINSLGSRARIRAEDVGPLSATLAVETSLELPARAIRAEGKRSEKLVSMAITTYITLEYGARSVNLRVVFDNQVEDHTLTVVFPTGLEKVETVSSGGHFNVDRRPAATPGPESNLDWPDMATQPQDKFVDLSDGKHGLAVLNNSLTEYKVSEDPSRTLELTLLRSVQNWICTESRVGSVFPSQKGGQCFGRQEHEYALMPHQDGCFEANIPLAANLFNAPLAPVQTRKKSGTQIELTKSYFSISNPGIIFSAFKKAENTGNYILRIHNPSSEVLQTTVEFAGTIQQAWKTSLNEERQAELDCQGGRIDLTVQPKEITTLEIGFQG